MGKVGRIMEANNLKYIGQLLYNTVKERAREACPGNYPQTQKVVSEGFCVCSLYEASCIMNCFNERLFSFCFYISIITRRFINNKSVLMIT